MTKIFGFLVMFIALTSVSSITHAQWRQWNFSSQTCYAYTNCYNFYGQVIGRVSCSVQSGGAWGGPCQWRVVPGRAVQCQGYIYQWGRPLYTPIVRYCPGAGPVW